MPAIQSAPLTRWPGPLNPFLYPSSLSCACCKLSPAGIDKKPLKSSSHGRAAAIGPSWVEQMAHEMVPGARRGCFRSSPSLPGLQPHSKHTRDDHQPTKEPDLTLPPLDKPYGTLTLSWLPTVPYVSPSTMTPAQETEPLVRDQTQTQTAPPVNPIYCRAPASSEIRLIRLPVLLGHRAPLHLSLETHEHKRHPEYEATSYT